LEVRIIRGDMIEVYKLLTGKRKIDYKQFFNFTDAPHSLRGHEKKLAKDRSRLDTRKFIFSQRVVNGWNGLPTASDKFNIGQQFQECLRPLLLQRYGQQKLISCRPINLQVQKYNDCIFRVK